MKKRLTVLLLCFAMLLCAAGCGAADTSSDGNKENAGKKPVENALDLEVTEQEKMFESARGTTMTKIGVWDDMNEYDQTVTTEFCDRYDISIEWIKMGYTEYVSKLPQMVAAGNPPDSAVMTDATSLSFMYSNLAQPLNQYLVLDDPYWDADVLKAFSIGDKYYGVNTGEIDTFFVYYNRTLFEELGLEDPYALYKNGKWTMEKLRELAKKATVYESDNTTVKTYGVGTYFKQVFALANGSDLISCENGTCKSNVKSAGALAGLNFLSALCADGSYNPNITGYTEFPARKIAMFIERPQHAIANYDLNNTMKDEIGIVPIPQGKNADKVYAPSVLTANFVPANAKNPVAGMAWNYFWMRRLADGEKENNPVYVARRDKMMNEEQHKIIYDFLNKSTKISSKLESLSGWGNYQDGFWADIVWNHKSAEEAAAKMDSTIATCAKNTVK